MSINEHGHFDPDKPPQTESRPENDQLEADLKAVWDDYNAQIEKIEQLSQKQDMPAEIVQSLRDAAQKQLQERLHQTLLSHQGKAAEQSGPQSGSDQQDGTGQSQGGSESQSSQGGQSSFQANTESSSNTYSSSSGTGTGNASNPRKIYRSETNSMLAGVCGGLGEYFEIDTALIRLFVALSTLFGIPGNPFLIVPIGYIVAAIVLPVKSEVQ